MIYHTISSNTGARYLVVGYPSSNIMERDNISGQYFQQLAVNTCSGIPPIGHKSRKAESGL